MKIDIIITPADIALAEALPPSMDTEAGTDFPSDFIFHFPDGTSVEKYAIRDSDGDSIDYNREGRTSVDSLVHRLLRLIAMDIAHIK